MFYEDVRCEAAVDVATRGKYWYMQLGNKISSKEGKVWEIQRSWLTGQINKLLNSIILAIRPASGFQLLKCCLRLKEFELGFLLSVT